MSEASAPSALQRLRQIADEIRCLDELPGWQPDQVAKPAGELLDEAIGLGAFAAAEYAPLRVAVRRAKDGRHEDWKLAVWDAAVTCLTPKLRRQPNKNGWVMACDPIANLIQTEGVNLDATAIGPGGEEAEAGQVEPAGTPPASPPQEEKPENRYGNLKEAKLKKLERRVRKAYDSLRYAEEKKGEELKDREAYDYLEEHGIDREDEKYGQLADYEVPFFDTWSRYVRKARKAISEQKHTPRHARPTGGSVIKRQQI